MIAFIFWIQLIVFIFSAECGDGEYYDDDSKTCKRCPEECGTCERQPYSSTIYCLTCGTSYFEQMPIKGTNYFYCQPCNNEHQSNCQKCTEATKCEICFPNYYVDSSTSQCSPCIEPCETCKDSGDKCITCKEGFGLNPSTSKCLKCTDNNCLHCELSNEVWECTKCKDGYFKLGDTCEKCIDSKCIECSDANTCTKCERGYYVNDADHTCSRCGDNCEECTSEKCITCKHEFYPVSGGNCEACAEVCSECNGPTAQDCINCDPGYFFSESNRNCFKCHESCINCTGPNDNDCIGACSEGYFRQDERCVRCETGCQSCKSFRECDVCKEGFYKEVVSSVDTDCLPCSQGCKKCEEKGDHQCTECLPRYYPKSTGNGNYVECTACPDNCQNCQEQGGQVTCMDCNDGYYKDGSKCIKCDEKCSKCTSKEECSECIPGYLFANNQCETRCSQDCFACEKTINNCISCNKGYVLNGNQCIKCPDGCQICETNSGISICQYCQEGFYKDGFSCKACDSTCATCAKEGSSNCYLCAEGYYKYKERSYPLYAGECHECKEADSNCVECTSECLDDYINGNDPCDFKCTRCVDGYYVNDNHKCEKCHASCKECSGPASNQCTSCYDEFTLNGTECQSSCRDNEHCDFGSINATDYEQFDREEIKYEGTTSESNGGALNIINHGVNIVNSNFTSCKSTKGAGGAIYICNNIEDETKTYEITIINLTFANCSAIYGGAVFIYSPSKDSPITIKSCNFTDNTVIGSSNSNNLYGGSAIYLATLSAEIIDSTFSRNKGKGGAVKISDDFSNIPISLRILQYESNETIGSIIIKGCLFETEKGSDCSLYYSNNKQLSKVNLMDCSFAGKLDKGAHHIDGQSSKNDYSKLFVNSCTFSDESRALSDKFIKINMINDHALAKSMYAKQQLSSKAWISIATLIFAAIIVFAINKRRQSNDELDNRDAQDTLDNSLKL